MVRAGMRFLMLSLLAIVVVPAGAADVSPKRAKAAAINQAAPPAEQVEAVTPRPVPPPRVEYGCKRLWRCDSRVCEWRRGCWGIYGYVEGPYYNLSLARRQWERDGWPTPRRYRD